MIPTAKLSALALAASALLSSAAAQSAATSAASAPLAAAHGVAAPDTTHLSLSDAVGIALATSDEVQQAIALTEIADAQVTTARAGALPQLRFNSGYTHQFANARAAIVGSVFNQPNSYTSTFSFSQPLFQGGRLIAASRAATDVRAASRLTAAETRATVTVAVQRAYLDALVTGRIAGLQARNLQLSGERLAQVEQFEKAGRAARYDVLRARVERANIEPLVIQARNDHELAMLELKRLLNIPVEQPVALTTTLDPDATRALAARLGADAESAPLPVGRAALQAAEATLRARREGVAIARADFLPTLAFQASGGFTALPPAGQNRFPTSRGFASNALCPAGSAATRVCQNGGWFEDGSFGFTFSLPLFDGLRAKGNLDLAQANRRLAELELRQTREEVAVDVARARAELARAEATFDARRATSSEAEEAFRLATLRFNRGLSTQLEVTDAQLALLTAQTGEARAVAELHLASVDLARALGRAIPLTAGGEVRPGADRPSMSSSVPSTR
ncbi:MAG TPA: TolC family protein [Gemmatimonadaceae bacterium]